MQMSLRSLAVVAASLVSSAAVAQTYIEPAPQTPQVVAPAAVVTPPPAQAPIAPVADVVVGTPEVTLQLHPVTHFGAAKQMFVHGATAMNLFGRHTETPKALGPVFKNDALQLGAAAKAGYFFTDMFAAGLTGDVNLNNNMSGQGFTMHVGPFVAVDVPLHHHLSFFPSLAGTYGYGNNINKASGMSTFAHDIELELQLTVLVHVTEHFSVSVSPYANQVVYGRGGSGVGEHVSKEQGTWATNYGAKLGLLFWR